MASKFESWNDFGRFEQHIVTNFRYLFDDWVQSFLATVINTSAKRAKTVGPETQLWRCQRSDEFEPTTTVVGGTEDELADLAGAGAEEVILEYQMAVPYKAARMKPLRDGATEGRVNPKGIPYLYLASNPNTAMSEARPPKGSTLTLAEFRATRTLRIVDCCHDVMQPLIGPDMSAENAEAVVWGQISNGFSTPVERKDNSAEYAPTQILGELFRRHAFDGVEFRSGLGDGHNFALFDLDAAEVVGVPQLYVTKNVVYEFDRAVPIINMNKSKTSTILPGPWLDQ